MPEVRGAGRRTRAAPFDYERSNISFTVPQMEAMRKHVYTHGGSVAQLVRDAVDEWLAKHATRKGGAKS